ncbi:MAG: hypothetical protein HOH61_12225 [Rhodospirillaceae bacterium]|nr:hypothetical protein [Rhodospirillaceae bacterium]
MTQSDMTIQNMFDMLQAEYGAFQDDAPAVALDMEFAHEASISDLPKIVQEAAALAA